jgi:hypothetical protein
MHTDSEKLKELEEKVSKALADFSSVSCDHGEECEEAETAKEHLAIAEKDLNDFKRELRKRTTEREDALKKSA